MKRLFSIVVPTRDRPELLRQCLKSILLQSFADYEVIVSDNCTERPARSVFEELADARFRYVKPPAPMPMAEHWEFCTQQARGEYVLVLIDKTLLLPSALKIAESIIARENVDVLTWWNEYYSPVKEVAGAEAPGFYAPGYSDCSSRIRDIDGYAEIARRFSMDVRRGTEGVNYFYGKICFGCYRQRLISHIRRDTGGLFFPLSPDYTSMMSALSIADRIVEVQRPLLMSINSSVSNGAQAAVKPQHALKFIGEYTAEFGPAHWPLQGLYASQHNCVAFDYMHMKERLGNRITCHLNMANLLVRAREDLDGVRQWSDATRRKMQYDVWQQHFHMLSIPDQSFVAESLRGSAGSAMMKRIKSSLRGMAATLPLAQSLARAVMGKAAPIRFKGIVDALRYADSFYAAAVQAADDGPGR